MKHCYRCGKLATTREHVPPICLFPEKKDIGFDIFRMNLITVPSCDEHNGKKSGDDEFFMTSMAGLVGNNTLGYIHTVTKIRRSLEKKRQDFFVAIMADKDKISALPKENLAFPVLLKKNNYRRLESCFESIAYGIFRYEFEKIFIGEVKIFMGFIKYQNTRWETLKEHFKNQFDFEK